MNSDSVLPNIDLIEDPHFLQFFNADQNQNHYLPNDNCAIGMPQHDGANQALHYMPPKTAAIPKSHLNPARSNLNNMNPTYSHNMGPISAMNSHNQMLNSPPMVAQMEPNSNNGQMNYCKLPPVPISTHYETPPIPRAYQAMADHHTSSSSADLNNFNQKYCPDNNGSINISNTLTHISETDNSHHNYAPTPPQSQTIKMSEVNSLNMITTPQTYPSMICNPSNNWNNISNVNSQMKCSTKSQNPNFAGQESRFSYLDPPNTDFLSITSTPVSSQPQPDPFMMRTNKNMNSNCLSKNKCNSFPIQNDHMKKPKPNTNSEEVNSNYLKKDLIVAEKQTIVILKVVERIIDPATKSVLKETILRDDEISTSCGNVQFDPINCHITSATSIFTRSAVGSSGVLGDISESLTHTKSIDNLSSIRSNNELNKSDFALNSIDNKNDTKNTTDSKDIVMQEKFTSPTTTAPLGIDENDEEERRQTASALLSLQSVSSTPVKENDDTVPEHSSVSAAASNLSFAAVITELNESEEGMIFPTCDKLRPGIKVMAKWKDKNFYPAQISKQLESHKWTVKFEDSANRNLFETEMIRLEHLLPKQDVMLTISDDYCIRATIKQVHLKNPKNYELDLEYSEDDKLIKKRHKLKDIFLNAEQSCSIIAKISKPNSGGAVFADVDLDNIVTGKRSRKQGPDTAAEFTAIKKSSDYSDSDSEATIRRKRKLNDTPKENSVGSGLSVDCKKTESLYSMGHYHENFLSVSPRASKNTQLAMPQHELEKILGPIPKSELKLFDKIGFLLTSGDRNKNVYNEQESRAERSTPFDKVYLTKQITAGSGKVFDTFEELKATKDNVECVLIADTYHRSIKYIQCLAAGIPIASHLWVIECCRANKLLDRDSYILPAGFSVISHSLSSDKSTLKKSSVLFRGMKFYFGSNLADKLEKLWSPVLFAAQATIVKQDENMHVALTRKSVDIIIGDASCKPELVARAKQLRIPVISSEYIVQCLINGRKLPYEASPYFSHAYKYQPH